MFCRKSVLIHFAKLLRKYLCRSKPVGLQLYYKETLMQTFSCEFCEFFKNTYFVGCSGFNKHIIRGMQYILTLHYDFIQFSQKTPKKHVRMCLSKFAYWKKTEILLSYFFIGAERFKSISYINPLSLLLQSECKWELVSGCKRTF